VSHRLWFIFSVYCPPAGLAGPTFIVTHAELCCVRNVPGCKQGYKQHISRISLLDRLWSSVLLIRLQRLELRAKSSRRFAWTEFHISAVWQAECMFI